jgi:hypothetical protein
MNTEHIINVTVHIPRNEDSERIANAVISQLRYCHPRFTPSVFSLDWQRHGKDSKLVDAILIRMHIEQEPQHSFVEHFANNVSLFIENTYYAIRNADMILPAYISDAWKDMQRRRSGRIIVPAYILDDWNDLIYRSERSFTYPKYDSISPPCRS